MFTNDNPVYFLQGSELWFCDETPYTNLFWFGIGIPALALIFYYILYRANFMPFKSSVRTVWYALVLALLLISFAGSYYTVVNFCYPENLLCETDQIPAEEVISEYINDRGIGKEAAIKALLQSKGIVVSDIAMNLTLNNLLFSIATIIVVSFGGRFISVHARYSPL